MESIDIFAQFFINSEFKKEFVDKEINAVNSEHTKNYTSNAHKTYQIGKIIAEKDSLVNRF